MRKSRILGNTDSEISTIGYGGMGQTHSYGVIDPKKRNDRADAVCIWRFCVLNKFFGGWGIYEKIKSKKNLTNFLLCVMNRIFCNDL